MRHAELNPQEGSSLLMVKASSGGSATKFTNSSMQPVEYLWMHQLEFVNAG
jgi:hypothetical protein